MKHGRSSWCCCMRHWGHGSWNWCVRHRGPGSRGSSSWSCCVRHRGHGHRSCCCSRSRVHCSWSCCRSCCVRHRVHRSWGRRRGHSWSWELLQAAARGLGPSVASDDCTCCRHNTAPPPPQTEKRALSLSLSPPPYLCFPRERNSEQRPGRILWLIFICRSGLNWLVMLLEAIFSAHV